MNNTRNINPDDLLKAIKSEPSKDKGSLRVFLGMSAGVGKTFAMLKAAHQKQNEGLNVLIGIVETHGRQETANLLQGLKILPKKRVQYRDTIIEEFDLEEAIKQKPDLIIIDELAHTNAPESRHPKRYQDVIEILSHGINVFTALNVQHLESRKDSVEEITGVKIHETVPDSILEIANQIELIDISPDELIKRLQQGKIYLADKIKTATNNFFKEDKLTALREISLRMTAERVDKDLQKFTVTKNEKPWQTNERLLVAISHSPYSEKLIRTTRRLAYNLEAPWIALHVDTGATLSDLDQTQLQKNLNLARELNAEVINTVDPDIASAVQRISRQKNVTQVILGRPTKGPLRFLLNSHSLLSKLINQNNEIDIHILRNENTQNPNFSHIFSNFKQNESWLKYYYAFWLFVAITMTGVFAEPLIGYRSIGFLLLLGVITTSLWGSYGVILFSSTLSALIWNWGFIPPRFTFVISNPDDMILLISNYIIAIITGILTNRTRVREKIIRDREEKTNLLNSILSDISNSNNKSEFIEKVCRKVTHYFDANIAVILKSKDGELQFSKLPLPERLDEKETAVASWCFNNQKNAGWMTDTLSQARSLYIPLKGVSETVGILIFRPERKVKKLSHDQQELLFSITQQLGISIERHFLSKRIQETQRLKDSELLHQTLLNSISHEMRTPLTTIIAVANSLENNSTNDKNHTLIESLIESSDRLNRVIENLLDMSRLNSKTVGLKLEWHDLTDLIGVILQKNQRILKNNNIQINIDENFDLIEIDYRLFEHALSNLLLNAGTYAGKDADIKVEAKNNKDFISIVVIDNGKGIEPEYQQHLFEKFYRVPGSPAGGTGLGLSIVKGIVELHGGKISYTKNLPHGSRFMITLPYKTPPQSKEVVSV